MQSKYEEEIVRHFAITFTESEVGAMALTLREWEAYGEIGYPPTVFQNLRKDLDRMIAESEMNL
jgi:hypothetical protein